MSYNIPDEVMNYAEEKGLEPLATGGGCDYMIRKLSAHAVAVLGCGHDAGSPCSLVDAACVTIYTKEAWEREWYSISFPRAVDAIDAIASMGFEVDDPISDLLGDMTWQERRHVAACLQIGSRMDLLKEGVEEILDGDEPLPCGDVDDMITRLVPMSHRAKKPQPDHREFRCWWCPDMYEKCGLDMDKLYDMSCFCDDFGYDASQVADVDKLGVGDAAMFGGPGGIEHIVIRMK